LWGEYETDDIRRGGFGPSNKTHIDEARDISAVVSPDAAYYLGILTGTTSVELDTSGKPTYKDDGYSIVPDIQECHFAFVSNKIPLGVAYSSEITVEKFGVKTSKTTNETSSALAVGFGNYVGTLYADGAKPGTNQLSISSETTANNVGGSSDFSAKGRRKL